MAVADSRMFAVLVDGRRFELDRWFLASNSEYFRALFDSGMRESQDVGMELREVTEQGFSAMLDVLRRCYPKIVEGNLEDVVYTASYLQVKALVEYLRFILSSDNCVQMLIAANVYGVLELKNAAALFIRNVIKNSRVSEDLMRLSPELVNFVRGLKPERFAAVASYCSSTPLLEDHSRAVYVLDEERNDWQLLTRLPPAASTMLAGVAVLGGRLYIVGGIQSPKNQPVEHTFRFDPQKDYWEVLNGLHQPRYNVSLLPYGNSLLAIGGKYGHKQLTTVECFQESSATWSLCPELPRAAAGAACATAMGRAFVALWKPLDVTTIYEFAPTRGGWDMVSTIFRSQSYGHCMLGHGHTLFLIRNGPSDDFLHCEIDSFCLATGAWTTLRGQYINGKGALFAATIKGDYVYTVNRVMTLPYAIESTHWMPLPALAGFPRGGTLHSFVLDSLV
uniref:LOW QUALITY PROTEIN: kelch repeat and BTB domain-containing protein 13-like n=1 Tax=Myxine glutinosa TaxID=7769 RepID=UPI00358FBBBB